MIFTLTVASLVILPTFAQQVYIPASGTTSRPWCTSRELAPAPSAAPSYRFEPFSFTQTETVRTVSVTPPVKPTATYAPHYSEVSHLINASTTSWSNWTPGLPLPTDSSDPYGQSAYSQLWAKASIQNFTRGMFSTTVSPTPVPTQQLVYPPPLYFGPEDCYYFPEGFAHGVASSAAQCEGAVADEGRGPAVTEILQQAFAGTPQGAENDFITEENYYYYKQDIERLAAMGVEYYSFTISWSRIMPFAVLGSPVNSFGLKHYDDLIEYCLEKGIKPVVTISHFDAPLVFLGDNPEAVVQKRGTFGLIDYGYTNQTIEDALVNYGKIVMTHYADRVPYWVTINEPQIGAGNEIAVDVYLKAHARLWHFYHDELNGTGKVSMKMGYTTGVPLDPSNDDHVKATQHFNDRLFGSILNPLTLGLDYPEAFKKTYKDYIPLTPEDLEYMNGTMDLIFADLYWSAIIYPVTDIDTCAVDPTNPYWPDCVGVTEVGQTGWVIGAVPGDFGYNTPTYIRTAINYFYKTFKKPVLVSEFGIQPLISPGAPVNDLYNTPQSEFLISYYTSMLQAIWEDGVEVVGALIWSYLDTWEFGRSGAGFGLQTFNATTQERTYRRSFFDVKDFIDTRRWPSN